MTGPTADELAQMLEDYRDGDPRVSSLIAAYAELHIHACKLEPVLSSFSLGVAKAAGATDGQVSGEELIERVEAQRSELVRLRKVLDAVRLSVDQGGDEYGPVPGAIGAALGTYDAEIALDAARAKAEKGGG